MLEVYEHGNDGAYKRLMWPRDVCYYCECLATEMDHCPPRYMRVEMYGAVQFYLIPCCRWCNSRLAGLMLFTPQNRKEYIKKLLDSVPPVS